MGQETTINMKGRVLDTWEYYFEELKPHHKHVEEVTSSDRRWNYIGHLSTSFVSAIRSLATGLGKALKGLIW